jgi:uncharacterized membrane protein YphA (DoxX/SURF4 family)
MSLADSDNTAQSAPTSALSFQTRWRIVLFTLVRWTLGGVLVVLGTQKALHPVDFLKVIREYHWLETYWQLNLVAGLLPWFEIFCGVLLVIGIAVRGTAVATLTMLLPFTAIVVHRALGIHQATAVPFCAIRFDCGCGAGEVNICRKVLENSALILMAVSLLARPLRRRGLFSQWKRR